jgi:hypothetical protein
MYLYLYRAETFRSDAEAQTSAPATSRRNALSVAALPLLTVKRSGYTVVSPRESWTLFFAVKQLHAISGNDTDPVRLHLRLARFALLFDASSLLLLWQVYVISHIRSVLRQKTLRISAFLEYLPLLNRSDHVLFPSAWHVIRSGT